MNDGVRAHRILSRAEQSLEPAIKAGTQLDEMLKSMAALVGIVDGLVEHKESLGRALGTCEHGLKRMECSLVARDKEIDQLKSKVARRQQYIQHIEGELNAANRHVEIIGKRMDEQANTTAGLHAEISRLRQIGKGLRDVIAELGKEKEALRRQCNTLAKEKEERLSGCPYSELQPVMRAEECRRELEELRHSNSQFVNQVGQLENALKATADARLKDRAEDGEKIRELQKALNEANRDRQELGKLNDRLRAELESFMQDRIASECLRSEPIAQAALRDQSQLSLAWQSIHSLLARVTRLERIMPPKAKRDPVLAPAGPHQDGK